MDWAAGGFLRDSDLCAWTDLRFLHPGQSAYQIAGITLTIVMLVTRGQAPWIIAVHRFIEVSFGIAVALTLTLTYSGRGMN